MYYNFLFSIVLFVKIRGSISKTSIPKIYYHGVTVIGIIIHNIFFFGFTDVEFYGLSLFGTCS